jgi:predicted DNA-binding WGR domain protein
VRHWINPKRGVRRFYSPIIEHNLFSPIRLALNWDQIGTTGQEIVELVPDLLDEGLSNAAPT